MRPEAADRALRRLIVTLASATSDDVDAVLGALDPARRDRAEALLADYRRGAIEQPDASLTVRLSKLNGLSPWLRARLEPKPSPATSGSARGPLVKAFGSPIQDLVAPHAMTPAAVEALRAAALDLPDVLLEPVQISPSWIERLRDRLGGTLLLRNVAR